MFVIKRPINGISLNGDEYLLDENYILKGFKTEQEALEFLALHGLTPENSSFSVEERQN